jgi:hypothetical protein
LSLPSLTNIDEYHKKIARFRYSSHTFLPDGRYQPSLIDNTTVKEGSVRMNKLLTGDIRLILLAFLLCISLLFLSLHLWLIPMPNLNNGYLSHPSIHSIHSTACPPPPFEC